VSSILIVAAGGWQLLVPGYQLYQSPDRRQASALFNRASYYPLTLFSLLPSTTYFGHDPEDLRHGRGKESLSKRCTTVNVRMVSRPTLPPGRVIDVSNSKLWKGVCTCGGTMPAQTFTTEIQSASWTGVWTVPAGRDLENPG